MTWGAMSAREWSASRTARRATGLQSCSVIIDDVLLFRALAQQFSADAPHHYIVGGSMSLLVKTFLTIKDALGLKHTPYVLAGYRGGGGACDYLRRTSNL
eukprot:5893806-Amphidinium_carterae.1